MSVALSRVRRPFNIAAARFCRAVSEANSPPRRCHREVFAARARKREGGRQFKKLNPAFPPSFAPSLLHFLRPAEPRRGGERTADNLCGVGGGFNRGSVGRGGLSFFTPPRCDRCDRCCCCCGRVAGAVTTLQGHACRSKTSILASRLKGETGRGSGAASGVPNEWCEVAAFNIRMELFT